MPAPEPTCVSPKPSHSDVLPLRITPHGVLAPTAEDLEKDGRWAQLAASFQKEPSLNMLRLPGVALTQEAIASLPQLTGLVHLTLFNNSIGIEEGKITVLCEKLRECEQLFSLAIIRNSLNDDHVPAIVSLIEEHPRLQVLDLSWNAIGAKGAMLLEKVRRESKKSVSFDLGFNTEYFASTDEDTIEKDWMEIAESMTSLSVASLESRLGSSSCSSARTSPMARIVSFTSEAPVSPDIGRPLPIRPLPRNNSLDEGLKSPQSSSCSDSDDSPLRSIPCGPAKAIKASSSSLFNRVVDREEANSTGDQQGTDDIDTASQSSSDDSEPHRPLNIFEEQDSCELEPLPLPKPPMFSLLQTSLRHFYLKAATLLHEIALRTKKVVNGVGAMSYRIAVIVFVVVKSTACYLVAVLDSARKSLAASVFSLSQLTTRCAMGTAVLFGQLYSLVMSMAYMAYVEASVALTCIASKVWSACCAGVSKACMMHLKIGSIMLSVAKCCIKNLELAFQWTVAVIVFAAGARLGLWHLVKVGLILNSWTLPVLSSFRLSWGQLSHQMITTHHVHGEIDHLGGRFREPIYHQHAAHHQHYDHHHHYYHHYNDVVDDSPRDSTAWLHFLQLALVILPCLLFFLSSSKELLHVSIQSPKNKKVFCYGNTTVEEEEQEEATTSSSRSSSTGEGGSNDRSKRPRSLVPSIEERMVYFYDDDYDPCQAQENPSSVRKPARSLVPPLEDRMVYFYDPLPEDDGAAPNDDNDHDNNNKNNKKKSLVPPLEERMVYFYEELQGHQGDSRKEGPAAEVTIQHLMSYHGLILHWALTQI